jgi:hypothetical protein
MSFTQFNNTVCHLIAENRHTGFQHPVSDYNAIPFSTVTHINVSPT